MDDTQFRTWKTQLCPLLYDWFSNHNLTWPTQACRWGPRLEEATFKYKYRLYLSEQTDAKYKEPPKLLVVDADICKPRVASTEAVTMWSEWSKAPYIKEVKTIVHPGEVNKIRELPQHPEVIVTHTDAPELYVWNVDTQPEQKKDPKDKSWPLPPPAELILTGHEADAQFPLATCNAAPLVASGGMDKLVLLWNLQDAMEGILAGKKDKEEKTTKEDKRGPTLANRTRLEGHKETVEDVVFKPHSPEQLASVGDDTQLLFWDTRTGNSPVCSVSKAHDTQDIHTVDWSGLQEHLLVTGAADGSLKVWDQRKLATPGSSSGSSGSDVLKVFNFHQEAIMRVEWHPTAEGVLASGGEDHLVVVWDLSRTKPSSLSDGGAASSSKAKAAVPPEVLFKHVGHRQGKVVDFQWCPTEPWTMLSVSDDTDAGEGEEAVPGRGGGTLQLWRINDFIYRDEEEVVKELESHREWILHGRNPPKQTLTKPSAANGVKPRPAAAAAAAAAQPAKAQTAGGGAAAATAVKQEVKEELPPPAAAAGTSGPPSAAAGKGEAAAAGPSSSAGQEAAAAAAAAGAGAGSAMEVEPPPAAAAAAAADRAAAASAPAAAAAAGSKPQEEQPGAAATADELMADVGTTAAPPAAGAAGDEQQGGEAVPMDADAPPEAAGQKG